MEVAVGKIADVLDRGAPVEPAAIHAVDRPRPLFRRIAGNAAGEFEIGDRFLLDMAGDAGKGGIFLEESQRGGQKIRIEDHVAVDQAQERMARMLVAELGADAATRQGRRIDPDDGDGKGRGDGEGAVARA